MKRIHHRWEKWECVPAGMYASIPPARMTADEACAAYAAFLQDISRFRVALARVLDEWPISCEQFLSNEGINRIAWLGQASMCIATGVPNAYRGGFKLLTQRQQQQANAAAAEFLSKWEKAQGDKNNGPTGERVHRELEEAGLF